jgi:uncharacterized protein DUF4382/uncharacterized protein DUF5666
MFKSTAAGLTLAITVGILAGCGGSRSQPSASSGTVVALIGDAPLCNVVSFNVTISDFSLIPTSGIGAAHIIPTASSFKVNLGALRDFSTAFYVNSATAESYNKATLSISSAQLAIYDPTQSPPVHTLFATITNTKPTFTIEPPMTVTKGQVSALQLELDMARSIQLDANGQVTGQVTPVFTVTPLTASGNEGFGELDDMVGFVRSVTPTYSTSTPQFIGNFLMQLFSGWIPAGVTVTVNFTPSTQLYGATDLSHLLTGSFVEVDGNFDSKGNFVANTVEVEDQENLQQNRIALIGPLTSLTKDSSGNLTGFDMWVRQEEPDDSFSVSLDSIVSVSLSSSTAYQVSSRSANFANTVFGPSALVVGQEVVVHGPFTKPASSSSGQTPPTTVAAEKVYLKLQSIQGNFASLVKAGSDDKTGAFWLNPCSPLFQGAPVLVITNSQTVFLNLSGLGALSSLPALLVKGLAFFEPKGGTINGITVPAGTLVMLAKQVHQTQ